jgi:hypothetical protein
MLSVTALEALEAEKGRRDAEKTPKRDRESLSCDGGAREIWQTKAPDSDILDPYVLPYTTPMSYIHTDPVRQTGMEKGTSLIFMESKWTKAVND